MGRKSVGDIDNVSGRSAWDEDDDVNPNDDSFDLDPDPVDRKDKARKACKTVLTHVGLCVLVILYCVGGAFLFIKLEEKVEQDEIDAKIEAAKNITALRAQLADELWKSRNKPQADYDKLVDDKVEFYQRTVSAAIQDHGYDGTIPENQILGWSFSSSLLYCITIVTTIGYGHVTPKTQTGQLITIFYSLVGVPLMLMFLANVGEVMANMFRIAYGRGCCYFCWKKRRENYEYNRRMVMKARGELPKEAWSTDKTGARRRKAERSPSPPWSNRSRSPSPANDAEKGKKKKRRESEEIDWEYLKTIDPDTIVCPDEEVINVPITLTLVVIAIYVFLGAVLFAAWETDWSWVKGAYFSFVTLSTIGFGDLVPGYSEIGTTKGLFKLTASMCYIILGLAVLSMSFNLMMEEMLSKFRWLGRKLGIIDDPDADAEDQKQFDEERYDSRPSSARSTRNTDRPTSGFSNAETGEVEAYDRKYL